MSTGRRARGITTWPAIDTIQGNALLVINSPIADAQRVGEVLDTLEARTRPGGVHVIADPEWASWLAARNMPAERSLLAVAKTSGRPVEVNHFLVAAETLLWAVPKAFEVIVGSTPHNQYNEEIQTVFEQRVSLLLGDGVLLAHCLPLPYVYVFDAAALVHRFGREARVREYQAHARRLVDDLYRLWQERGKPAVEDGDRYDASLAVIERHLGRDVVTFDEESPIVIPQRAVDEGEEGARLLAHLREQLHTRDLLVAERSEAVEIRDRLLAQIRGEALPARLRRLAGRGE
jgi:hypothetical protein